MTCLSKQWAYNDAQLASTNNGFNIMSVVLPNSLNQTIKDVGNGSGNGSA